MYFLIGTCLLLALGLYNANSNELFRPNGGNMRKEKFTRRINNLQPIMNTTSDEHTWIRNKSYYNDQPSEYSNLDTKAPEKKSDFSHTNEVPFFKKEPYYAYLDASHPFLDRYTGDRPKKEVIAPLTELGQNNYLNKNELVLEKQREVEEMEIYKNNFSKFNSKKFQYVGGDPIRVGPNLGKEYTAEPAGGFHPFWRPNELTYEELTGHTRPDFDEAIRVAGLQGHRQVPLGDMTKRKVPTAVQKSQNYCNLQPGSIKRDTQRPEKLVMKQQKTLDAPMYPYTGPARGSKNGQDINKIFNEDIQPRETKWDPSVSLGEVNYYNPTSDPGYYKRNSDYWRKTDKATDLEKYANYKMVDTKVQKHIYKDYDDYEWNNMKNGNEYVCNSRRGNINAGLDLTGALYYDPEEILLKDGNKNEDYIDITRKGNISIKTNGEFDVRENDMKNKRNTPFIKNKYLGGLQRTVKKSVDHEMDLVDTNKHEFARNNRTNARDLKDSTYGNFSDNMTAIPNAVEYMENKYKGNVATKASSTGYQHVPRHLRHAKKTGSIEAYTGSGGNNSGNRTTNNLDTIQLRTNKNNVATQLKGRKSNPMKNEYTTRQQQEQNLKKKNSIYNAHKAGVFNISNKETGARYNGTKYQLGNKPIVQVENLARPQLNF